MTRRFRIGLALAATAAVLTAIGLALAPRLSPPGPPAGQVARSSVLTVTVVDPGQDTWPRTVAANGGLAAWQEAVIGAEVGSLRITHLFADVGSVVRKGDELARLSRDTALADRHKQEAAVASAKASLAQAVANARRARLVRDSGALSEEKVTEYLIAEETARASLASAEAELESARITLDQTSIRAVDDGVITARSATLGNVVSAGTDLFRLQRQSRVEWQAELDAVRLPAIHPGQTARLTLPDGAKITGRVRQVAPALSSTTGRAIVYVALPAGRAAAGSFASGEIEIGPATVMTLPQSAVVLRDGRAYVFTVDDDGVARRHPVTTGMRRDTRIEIIDGITPATKRVVAAGGAFLSEGSPVTVAGAEGGQ